MNKAKMNKITVALTSDQVDAHNDNYSILADKDIELYNELTEKLKNNYCNVAVVSCADSSDVFLNPVKMIATVYETEGEASEYIKTLKFSFKVSGDATPTHIALTASYVNEGAVAFFLYSDTFNGTALYADTEYTIEYSRDESAWVISE